MDSKNSNTLLLSKKSYTKQDKIRNYRKKYSNIRHQYYSMATKYKEYNKLMLTFTIPSKINDKTILRGKYSKTSYLLEIRSYIAKQFNNSDVEIKYFSNIELGTNRNNPHLHIQVWIKDNYIPSCRHQENGIDEVYGIYKKTIEKFNLNFIRCKLTTPTHDKIIYDYIIKDYRKDILDTELWANENAKKGIRKQLGKQVRFYNMSSDKYSQKIYKIMYRYYGKLREYVNKFVSKFIDMFFALNSDGIDDFMELKSELLDILEQVVKYSLTTESDNKKATYLDIRLLEYWIYGFLSKLCYYLLYLKKGKAYGT